MNSRLFVIETDEDRYLGSLKIVDGQLRVLVGSAGRPVAIDIDELVSIVPADEHPDVDGVL